MINWQGVSLRPPWETSHPGASGKRTAGNFWKPPAFFVCQCRPLQVLRQAVTPVARATSARWHVVMWELFWRVLTWPLEASKSSAASKKTPPTTTKKTKLNPLTIMTGRPADTPSTFSPPGRAVFSDRWPLGVSKLPNTGCGDRGSQALDLNREGATNGTFIPLIPWASACCDERISEARSEQTMAQVFVLQLP